MRWQVVVSIALMLIGISGLVTYDYYIRPVLLAKTVVVAKEEITENQVITSDMLTFESVPNDLIPSGAVLEPRTIIGKTALVTIGAGTMLTQFMLDMQGIYPVEGEVIFPIPKEAIFAVNGSLRRNDLVDINVLIKENRSKQAEGDEMEEETLEFITTEPIIRKARVVYARTEDNQNVKDTEEGKDNYRETSTGRVATVEILVSEEKRDAIIREIEKGNQLWIARVGK